jgi:hypothetical protein
MVLAFDSQNSGLIESNICSRYVSEGPLRDCCSNAILASLLLSRPKINWLLGYSQGQQSIVATTPREIGQIPAVAEIAWFPPSHPDFVGRRSSPY